MTSASKVIGDPPRLPLGNQTACIPHPTTGEHPFGGVWPSPVVNSSAVRKPHGWGVSTRISGVVISGGRILALPPGLRGWFERSPQERSSRCPLLPSGRTAG